MYFVLFGIFLLLNIIKDYIGFLKYFIMLIVTGRFYIIAFTVSDIKLKRCWL